jgi:GTPase SAR1 family protein
MLKYVIDLIDIFANILICFDVFKIKEINLPCIDNKGPDQYIKIRDLYTKQ